MTINEIIWTSVGADLSCTSPIYRPSLEVTLSAFNIQSALSRPSPIYRPSVHLIDNLIIWLNRIIAPGKRNSAIQGVQ